MKRLGRLTLVFIVLASCSKKELLPSELIHWVENEENGLRKRQNFENYFFEAKYKPIEYIIALEGRSDVITQGKYESIREELSGLQYLDLNIGTLRSDGNALSSSISSNEEYFERLDYFITYARHDIFMVQGKDTLYPKLFHFERNYGLAPKNTLLLGFDQIKTVSDRILIIDDQILGVGRVKFMFENDKINLTPTLKRI